MRFCFRYCAWLIGLVAFGAAGLLVSTAAESTPPKPQKNRPIEFSPEINPTDSFTNLNRLPTGNADILRQFRELTKENSFSPASSLDAIPAPVYVPPPSILLPSRQLRTQRDGVFSLTGESPDGTPNDGSLFRTRKNKKASGFDDLQETFGTDSSSTGSRGSQSPAKSLLGNAADDEDLPRSIRDSERQLRKELGGNSPGDALSPNGGQGFLLDLFGSGNQAPSREDMLAHQKYMDQYRQEVLGIAPVGTAANTLGSPSPSRDASPGYGNLNPLANPSSSKAPASSPAALNSLMNPGRATDVNSTVLNQWNPLYTPPKIEPPKMPRATSVQQMEVVRRKF